MANKNIITSGARVNAVSEVYYAPVSEISNSGDILSSFYAFLSKAEPWPDNNDPPAPTEDELSLKRVYKNIFVVKKIATNDISPVIERINWQSGTTYAYYRDDVNMLELDENGFLVRKFYVKNKYDQVFKCLWNNNGAPSTVEPYFEPGTYGARNMFQSTDNYKWKYIYTVDLNAKVKFLDTRWMPVPARVTAPSSLDNGVGSGNIDVINVTNGGSGYDIEVSPVTVKIVGDGTTTATGTAVLSGDTITDILVTNAGANYSYANVSITSGVGSGATAVSPVSPIAGHGSSPITEFGCSHVMLTAEFNGTENGAIPVDIDFHQVGLLVNPTTLATHPNSANDTIYKTSTDLALAQGFGSYSQDEYIYQGNSLASATYKAVVLSFDTASNVLRLINITGTPKTNAPVYGNTSKTARTLLSVSAPTYTTFSGQIMFVENRSGVQRSEDGIEQFKFVLGY